MKIAVLTSGGVDSSVALHLLEEQDHDVTAFYLKIWLEDELSHLNACPWQTDTDYVREVCRLCDAKLHVVAMQQEYHKRVVQYSIDQVRQGLTPNPDIFCNKLIKFGIFLERYGENFDAVASGHYAQTAIIDGKTVLKQAPDSVKDQTYFLSQLSSQTLSKLVFPIGHLAKGDVRRLAQEFGLPNKDRKDSQGICFLGRFKYKDYLEHHLGTKPGPFVEWETGKNLGEHRGFWFHTNGQRRGIGLSGGPWFVVCKNPDQNVVYISRHYKEIYKNKREFYIHSGNWFLGKAPVGQFQFKLRHGPEFNPGVISETGFVVLEKNDQGISPGQFAAIYDDDGICYGSGEMTVVATGGVGA